MEAALDSLHSCVHGLTTMIYEHIKEHYTTPGWRKITEDEKACSGHSHNKNTYF